MPVRRQRYLEKLERFEEEYEFIKSHEMKGELLKEHCFTPSSSALI